MGEGQVQRTEERHIHADVDFLSDFPRQVRIGIASVAGTGIFPQSQEDCGSSPHFQYFYYLPSPAFL